MPGLPLEREEVLEDAEVAADPDLGSRLFSELPSHGVLRGLSELDAAAEEPVEAFALHGVVGVEDEDLVTAANEPSATGRIVEVMA